MKTCLLYTTNGRTDLLATSLNRLETLTRPDEILVVDDGGPDPANLATLCGAHGARYLRTENPGETMCSHARNVGITHTDAELVITCEPELLFVTDVIPQLVTEYEQCKAEDLSVAVNVGTVFHEQAPGTPSCYCCGERLHKTVNWEATWCTLYERDALIALGGWDEEFPDSWGWEDTDLLTRLRISGVGKRNLITAEAVHQWHPHRMLDQVPNETHFRSKGFNGDERPDHPELIANRAAIHDCTWGMPR